MEGINFVALDVETANYNKYSICSIGLVKFIDGNIVDKYETLINPEEKFDSYNIHLHGITEDIVKNSPTYPQIVPSILKFVDSLPVVMHDARFDAHALRQCNERYNISDFYMEYFCSYYLSQAVITRLSYKLKNLSKEFGIPLNHHNALSDAKASGLLILELIKQSNLLNLQQLFEKAYYHKLGIIKGYELTPFIKGNGVISSQKSTKEFLNLVDKLDLSQFDETHPFYRKYGVVTGKLEHFATHNEALSKFEEAGGLRERYEPKNITNKTNFLIMGKQDPRKKGNKDGSTKISSAQKRLEQGQDIELLSEDDFIRMLQLPITPALQDNPITEVVQDNLKKITSVNGFTFIIDDMSSERDKRQGIYRGDNLLLSRRKTLDPITPLFAKDAQTVRHENVSDITEPNATERDIFLTLKAGQELTDEHKEYIKSNYVK